MTKRVLVLVCCAVLAGRSQSVQAAPLNLNLSYYPDIVTGFIEVTYTAADNHLLIDGFATHIWDGVSAEPDEILGDDYNYHISATIDESGNPGGGTLVIEGTIPTWNLDSGTLLTGNLIAFGFQEDGGEPLEFLFEVTGGDLSPQFHYGPLGVILSNIDEFGGSFASDFNNNSGMHGWGYGMAMADTYPNPEPATLFLLAAGIIVARKRRISKA